VVHGPEAAQELIGAREPTTNVRPREPQPAGGAPKAALSPEQLQKLSIDEIERYYAE
jgi:hypothetical protein